MKNRATIVCWKDGRILFVTRGRSRWALPGGTVKLDETPLQAALRELREETRIVAETLTYRFAFGGLSKRHHVFMLELPFDAKPQPSNEIVDCRWVAPDEVALLSTSVPTREIVALLGAQPAALERA